MASSLQGLEQLEDLVKLMPDDPVTVEELKNDWDDCRQMLPLCEELGLTESSRICRIIRDNWTADGVNKLIGESRFMSLRESIHSELKSVWMLKVSAEDASLYTEIEPFGPKVANIFSVDCAFDIEEASKCLALGRSIATVFHLMRIMEHGVQHLGLAFNYQMAASKEWQKILNAINKGVEGLPQDDPPQKKIKEKYAEIASHLFQVKMAWRNPVMHPQSKYSPEEAAEIYRDVKRFMMALAELSARRFVP